MPVPVFCKVPVPLTTPDAVTIPVPPIIAAAGRVISPEVVAAVALLLTKDPPMLKSSAVVNPFKSTIAPEAIVVAVVVPNASLLPNFNVPVVTVVVPLYVLVPDIVKVPVPALVTAMEVAVPFSIIPEKTVEVLSPPEVIVSDPLAELVTVPAPAKDPTVSLKPFKSNMPFTVTALVFVILSAAPNFKVPAEIVVEPV